MSIGNEKKQNKIRTKLELFNDFLTSNIITSSIGGVDFKG